MSWENETPPPVPDRGPWIATASGGFWSLLAPHPADVSIRDIAAGMSRTCRYAGQIREEVDFYAVTEHSVLMEEWLESQGLIEYCEDGLKVLLHDASEGYLVDLASPLKALIPEYRKIEDRAQAAIDAAFGLHAARISREIIKSIDVRIRMDEREALINEPALSEQKRVTWEHTPDMQGLDVEIRGLSPREARKQFLRAFIRICENLPLRDLENAQLIVRQLAVAHELVAELAQAPKAIQKGSRDRPDLVWSCGPAEAILAGARTSGPFPGFQVASAHAAYGELVVGVSPRDPGAILYAARKTAEGFIELSLDGLEDTLFGLAAEQIDEGARERIAELEAKLGAEPSFDPEAFMG